MQLWKLLFDLLYPCEYVQECSSLCLQNSSYCSLCSHVWAVPQSPLSLPAKRHTLHGQKVSLQLDLRYELSHGKCRGHIFLNITAFCDAEGSVVKGTLSSHSELAAFNFNQDLLTHAQPANCSESMLKIDGTGLGIFGLSICSSLNADYFSFNKSSNTANQPGRETKNLKAMRNTYLHFNFLSCFFSDTKAYTCLHGENRLELT